MENFRFGETEYRVVTIVKPSRFIQYALILSVVRYFVSQASLANRMCIGNW